MMFELLRDLDCWQDAAAPNEVRKWSVESYSTACPARGYFAELTMTRYGFVSSLRGDGATITEAIKNVLVNAGVKLPRSPRGGYF